MKNRKVVIGFDANVASNWKVRKARQVYAETLAAHGANVLFLNLPEERGVNGPDDYIAAHGGDAFLELLDAAEEWRTTIVVHAGRHPEAVDQAEDVLLKHGESLLFQRGGELVRIVELESEQRSGGIRRKAGTAMLVPVTAVALTEILDRLILWQKLSETKDGPRPYRVDCPARVAGAYLSRLGFWKLPVLTGIVSAPVMRHDGTILRQAWYDPQTGLFLADDWPELAGSPSRAEALAGLGRLKEPFSEFPFIGQEDFSVLIAAELTTIQRRLLLPRGLSITRRTRSCAHSRWRGGSRHRGRA